MRRKFCRSIAFFEGEKSGIINRLAKKHENRDIVKEKFNINLPLFTHLSSA